MSDDAKITAELTRDEVGELLQHAQTNYHLNATEYHAARGRLIFALISDPDDADGDHANIRQSIERCRENSAVWQRRVEYLADLLGVFLT